MAPAAQLVSDIGASGLIGKRIDTYQVQARIGAGGMGEVYRAFDTNLHRAVAIKLLFNFNELADRRGAAASSRKLKWRLH